MDVSRRRLMLFGGSVESLNIRQLRQHGRPMGSISPHALADGSKPIPAVVGHAAWIRGITDTARKKPLGFTLSALNCQSSSGARVQTRYGWKTDFIPLKSAAARSAQAGVNGFLIASVRKLL